MDVNEDWKSLEGELESILGADDRISAHFREIVKKAKDVASFCGTTGYLVIQEWKKDESNTVALERGVYLLNLGKDVAVLSDYLTCLIERKEKEDKEEGGK